MSVFANQGFVIYVTPYNSMFTVTRFDTLIGLSARRQTWNALHYEIITDNVHKNLPTRVLRKLMFSDNHAIELKLIICFGPFIDSVAITIY